MPSLKPGYEIEPNSRVPPSFRPPDSIVHRVSDGEDWHSVAKRYNLPVKYLIHSNFKTMIPKEINWYLREYIRCDLPTADRKNWRFSTSARLGGGPRPGVVYIPLNWKAIVAAAKRETRFLVNMWFRSASMGPESTEVVGSLLSVFPSAVRTTIDGRSPILKLFEDRLKEAGAPDDLARTWPATLFQGLSLFTAGIYDIQPGAFPGMGASSLEIAVPWPLLASSKADGLLEPRHLKTIIQTAKIDGQAANKAIREYALWFQFAFGIFRQVTLATNVTAIVSVPGGMAKGFAIGHPGFLSGRGMVL